MSISGLVKKSALSALSAQLRPRALIQLDWARALSLWQNKAPPLFYDDDDDTTRLCVSEHRQASRRNHAFPDFPFLQSRSRLGHARSSSIGGRDAISCPSWPANQQRRVSPKSRHCSKDVRLTNFKLQVYRRLHGQSRCLLRGFIQCEIRWCVPGLSNMNST